MIDTPENHPEPEKKAEPNTKPYKIGYGKPPKERQWKSGQSGNPEGRRRREEEPYGDLIDRILREKVPCYDNGKPISMTKLKASARTVVDRGIAGNPVYEPILIKIEGPVLSPRSGSSEIIHVDHEDEIPRALAAFRKGAVARHPDDYQGTKNQASWEKRRGRPRDDVTFVELVRRELNKTIKIQENGRTITVTKREAWIRRLINGTSAGNHKGVKSCMKVVRLPEASIGRGNVFFIVGGR